MTRRWALATGALVALTLSACESDDITTSGPRGQSAFRRYVALGTSVSMGYGANGVLFSTQVYSWPAQLAHAAQVEFSQPLIAGPGCNAPLIAPLQFGFRLNGLPSSAAPVCAPLLPGIELPANNVAIEGSTAFEAVDVTPVTAGTLFGPFRQSVYRRVLRDDQTQVTAMLSQDPTFVSVEFGANEVLRVQSGVLAPNLTYTPLETFRLNYNKIIDSVKTTGAKAVLVGLIDDVRTFSTIRTAAEIHAESLAFHAFYVTIGTQCKTSPNVVTVPLFVPAILGRGQAAAAAGQPRPVITCADVPGQQDATLTQSDITFINSLLVQMDTVIAHRAQENGYAHFRLQALYGIAKSGNPFRLTAAADQPVAFLSGATPYGPLISIDGVHPSREGHSVIAQAAVDAINQQYGFDLLAVRPLALLEN